MPKTNWTPEERKAFGEKMKAAKAAAKYEQNLNKLAEEEQVPTPKEEATISVDDYQSLLKQVQELKSMLGSQTPPNEGAQPTVSAAGQLLGVKEKFSTDPKDYPSPVAKLMKESRLAPFGFEYNYELEFVVSPTTYQNISGVNMVEPRFHVKLIYKGRDDQGNDNGKRYIIRNLVFHEDPAAALDVARREGLEIQNSQQFMDDMRYLRIRNWLFEAFYPPKTDAEKRVREEVIGNTVVQFYETSSVEAKTTNQIMQ